MHTLTHTDAGVVQLRIEWGDGAPVLSGSIGSQVRLRIRTRIHIRIRMDACAYCITTGLLHEQKI